MEDEENTFFCGPQVDGWLKAAELCLPCPNGDPEHCGLGMTCYSGVVTCSEPKSNTAEEMLLEVEERVHLGYCGSEFYETKDNCSIRRPCTLDSDCDMWNPSCYAVSCEDEPPPTSALGEGSDTIVTVRRFVVAGMKSPSLDVHRDHHVKKQQIAQNMRVAFRISIVNSQRVL